MITIGHHTCLKEGGKEKVLEEAPFPSKIKVKVSSKKIRGKEVPIKTEIPPFLGEGYYFWDDNIELGKWWGNKILNEPFYIIEAELTINDDSFLDLVGNRQCMKWIKSMYERILTKEQSGKLSLGKFIEMLKRLKRDRNDIALFPYTVVRALDYSHEQEEHGDKILFKDGMNAFTLLNPRIIICFIEKDNNSISSKKISFTS